MNKMLFRFPHQTRLCALQCVFGCAPSNPGGRTSEVCPPIKTRLCALQLLWLACTSGPGVFAPLACSHPGVLAPLAYPVALATGATIGTYSDDIWRQSSHNIKGACAPSNLLPLSTIQWRRSLDGAQAMFTPNGNCSRFCRQI